ncbi:hypothetical protein LINPERHAP2_LOCUS9759, partial [Linum perenne]
PTNDTFPIQFPTTPSRVLAFLLAAFRLLLDLLLSHKFPTPSAVRETYRQSCSILSRRFPIVSQLLSHKVRSIPDF